MPDGNAVQRVLPIIARPIPRAAVAAILGSVLVLVCSLVRAAAVPEWPGDSTALTRWTLRDGLPDNAINGVLVATDGYLWIATQSGLARFDGARIYTLDAEPASGLDRDPIRSLACDSEGSIWCATRQGVVRIRNGSALAVRESEGLAGDGTFAVRRAARGGVWIAGQRGVSWSDGNRTQAYTLLPAPNTTAFALEEMPDQRLFVGSNTGLFELDPATGEFREVWKPPGVSPESNATRVRHLSRDDEGRLWIGGAFGLYRWAVHDGAEAKFEPQGDLAPIHCLHREPGQGLWIGTGNRVLLKPPGETVPRPLFDLPRDSQVRCLAGSPDGSSWIGTDRAGLFRGSRVPAAVIDARHGLIHPEVHAITPGASDGVWFATEGGIQAYSTRAPAPGITLPSPGNGPLAPRTMAELSDGTVLMGSARSGVFFWRSDTRNWEPLPDWSAGPECHVMLAETNGVVWIGTSSGLTRVHVRLPSLASAPEARPASPPKPTSLITYRPGSTTLSVGAETWVVHTNRWFRREGEYDVRGNREAAQTALGEAVIQWALPDGLPSADVRVVRRDSRHTLWIGTRGGGLFALKPENLTVVQDPEEPDAPPVWSLFEDHEQLLWVGTGAGLRRVIDGRLQPLRHGPALPSRPVWQVLGDGRDYLWLLTDQGVVRVRRDDLVRLPSEPRDPIRRLILSDLDGTPSTQISGGSQPAGCTTPDGILWVPTHQGVVRVDPRLVEPPGEPPSVHIESVETGSEPASTNPAWLRWSGAGGARVEDLPWRGSRSGRGISPPPPTVTLPAEGGRSVLIRFSATAFGDPLRTRFRFRLVGHDPDWIEAGSERQAHYSNLRPGRYRFEVLAANRWNVWNRDGAALDLHVERRFTESPGFFIACGLLGAAVILQYLRQYRHRVRETQARRLAQREADFRLRLSQDLHDDFGSGLARILMLAGTARRSPNQDPAADGFFAKIEQVAHETSRTLSRFIWTVNARNDSLPGLLGYCARAAEDILRPANIALRLDFPPEIPEIPLPGEIRNELFLVLKEALNNAAKHSSATQVHLRFVPDRNVLRLEIHDNGKGLPHSVRMALRDAPPGSPATASDSRNSRSGLGGHGLANMFARVERLGGQLEIESRQDDGTLLELSVPYDQIRGHHRG